MRRSVAALTGILLLGGCMQTTQPESSDETGSAIQTETQTVVLRVPGMT